MNHFHLADLHQPFCEDISSDRLVALGTVLQQIHILKLGAEFPRCRCTVEFYLPEYRDDLREYQLTFWQPSNESISSS